MGSQITFEAVAFWKNPAAMSESKAAELAAQKVEEILATAEAAAEQIRQEARDQVAGAVAEARQKAAQIERRARDQAIEFDADSRREAERMVAEAKRRAAQIRGQTKRSVAGRVERAEAAANEMVSHAEALSDGLLRLGELLTEQGERILRDVQAARRDLREKLQLAIEGRDGAAPEAGAEREERPAARRANGARRGRVERGTSGSDELAPPEWVERA
jgi:hypothetical protein